MKEADALSDAGHGVRVLCGYWAAWAHEADQELLKSRRWSCSYVGGIPSHQRLQYLWTRFRHGIARRSVLCLPGGIFMWRWAMCRVLPELESAAKRTPADLYIAHYPAALAAAMTAAEQHGSQVGFDAEDFHSGERTLGMVGSVHNRMAEVCESRYLPRCHYVTASSPEIADSYAVKYGIPRPVPILNVFPLSQRPRQFRPLKESGPLTLYWFSQTIGPGRGLEDVVQAMGRLPAGSIQLNLRGEWQPAYRRRLLNLAASTGVKPQQIISHDPAPSDQMVRLAAEYDVGLALEHPVSENRRLCLTNKIFTYLLAGNAVIATDTKGQRPILDAIGSAGFCYAPGDPQILANHLRLWLEDRGLLVEARRQAWYWGTRQYNWDIEKEKFLRVIEQASPRASS